MLNRYHVTYVGDDSYTHRVSVWAKDHRTAVDKFLAKYDGVDGISNVQRASNLKFWLWAIVFACAALAIVAYALR